MPWNELTVFQKTEKGNLELKTRQAGLSAVLRQLLILIDGKRTCEQLGRMLPARAMEEGLVVLEANGFIHRGDGAAGASSATGADAAGPAQGAGAHGTATTVASAPQSVAPATAAAGSAARREPAESFDSLRRRVVRALVDSVGPVGDDMAMRLEKTRSTDELRRLMPTATQLIEAVRGRAAAESFIRQIGTL